jgi:hypothetical protein
VQRAIWLVADVGAETVDVNDADERSGPRRRRLGAAVGIGLFLVWFVQSGGNT